MDRPAHDLRRHGDKSAELASRGPAFADRAVEFVVFGEMLFIALSIIRGEEHSAAGQSCFDSVLRGFDSTRF